MLTVDDAIPIRNPWDKERFEEIHENDTVLLLGTGLTMVDIASDLYRCGVRRMIAISRRGLLARSHRYPARPALPGLLPPGLMDIPATARGYLRRVRSQVSHCAALGIDWRDVIASLRPHTAALWAALDTAERRRFLRHLKPYWEVHRHRVAPELAFVIERLIADGLLTLHAGRVSAYKWSVEGVEATLKRRGRSEQSRLRVHWVVNCTGPGTDVGAMDDPLMQALLARGLIQPDPLGLGVGADEDGRLYDGGGQLSRSLFHVGPLLKGVFWECTAVPELRSQAQRVASAVVREWPGAAREELIRTPSHQARSADANETRFSVDSGLPR